METGRGRGLIDKDGYSEYLLTDHWNEVRKERLKIDRYRCQFCGCEGTSANPLVVHHFTYRNLGHEDVWRDLVTVCSCCHAGIHQLMQRKTSADGERGWCATVPFSTHVLAEENGPRSITVLKKGGANADRDNRESFT